MRIFFLTANLIAVVMSPYTHWLVPLSMLLTASTFLAIGLRGLIRKQPFLVSARWVLLYAILLLSLQGWLPQGLPGGHLRQQWPCLLIEALAYAGIVGLVWSNTTRSYWAYGVTTTSLHDGLRAALKALGLRSEVGFGGVYLENGTYISISMNQPHGIGRIRCDGNARRMLGDVVAGMNRYYAASNVATNWTACYLLVVAGLLLTILPLLRVLRG